MKKEITAKVLTGKTTLGDDLYFLSLFVGKEERVYCCFREKNNLIGQYQKDAQEIGRLLKEEGITSYSMANGSRSHANKVESCEPIPEQVIQNIKETIDSVLTKNY